MQDRVCDRWGTQTTAIAKNAEQNSEVTPPPPGREIARGRGGGGVTVLGSPSPREEDQNGCMTHIGVSKVERNDAATGSCGQNYPSGAFGACGQAGRFSLGGHLWQLTMAGRPLEGVPRVLRGGVPRVLRVAKPDPQEVVLGRGQSNGDGVKAFLLVLGRVLMVVQKGPCDGLGCPAFWVLVP